MNKLRLFITLIFFTVMTIMWTSLDDQVPLAGYSPVDDSERAEYVASDLNRIVYDKSGRVTQQLSAKKMTYFDAQNRAEFESPLLIVQSRRNDSGDKPENGTPERSVGDDKINHSKWRISAISGILYNNERLLLEKNVDAVNLTEHDYINRIAAQNISVNIKDSTLMSDDIVRIYGDDVTMIGSGLIAHLNDQQIELINHAETIYQSDKK